MTVIRVSLKKSRTSGPGLFPLDEIASRGSFADDDVICYLERSADAVGEQIQ